MTTLPTNPAGIAAAAGTPAPAGPKLVPPPGIDNVGQGSSLPSDSPTPPDAPKIPEGQDDPNAALANVAAFLNDPNNQEPEDRPLPTTDPETAARQPSTPDDPGGQQVPRAQQPVQNAPTQPAVNPRALGVLKDAGYTEQQIAALGALSPEQQAPFIEKALNDQIGAINQIPQAILERNGIGTVDPRALDPLAPTNPNVAPDPLAHLRAQQPPQPAQSVPGLPPHLQPSSPPATTQAAQNQRQQPAQFVPISDAALAELEAVDPNMAQAIRTNQQLAQQQGAHLQAIEQRAIALQQQQESFIRQQVQSQITGWFDTMKGDELGDKYHGPHGAHYRGQVYALAKSLDEAALQQGRALSVGDALTAAHRYLHMEDLIGGAHKAAQQQLAGQIQKRSGLRTFTPAGGETQQYQPGTDPEQDQINAENIVAGVLARNQAG